MKENTENNKDRLSVLLALILDPSWVRLVAEVWKLARKLLRGMADEGVSEVIEQESTLELLDSGGEGAIYKKHKKVRYLQNGIIAYQDFGWADGEYLLDYRVSPGVAVDRYKIGYKHYVLISLRGIRNKGDIDDFHIEWKIKHGFLKPDGYWQVDVDSRMRHLKFNVFFPKDRPPQTARLVENNIRRTSVIGADSIVRMPDGKWQVSWETTKPRFNEQYILRWDW